LPSGDIDKAENGAIVSWLFSASGTEKRVTPADTVGCGFQGGMTLVAIPTTIAVITIGSARFHSGRGTAASWTIAGIAYG
jgi:hypothetical protein